MRHYLVVIYLSTLALTGLVVPAPAGAQSDRLCFNVPGITECIAGRFREYWEQNGGLPVFGYPLTAARYERSRDVKGGVYLTQWFERNSFELHPENTRPYDVLLGRLADYRLLQQDRVWPDEPKASGPQAGCTWFAETSHNVCDQVPNLGFQHYLRTHGLSFDGNRAVSPQESLALIGLPLTEARTETNASGDTVLTQWFERARLEWHPDQPDQYKALLGLLGTELRTFVPPLKTNCAQPVVDELRRQYEEVRDPRNVPLRQALGCPQWSMRDLPAAAQAFEGGTMLWHAPTTTKGLPNPEILVIFGDTRPPHYISYPDTWGEGQPESGGEVPPAGRYAPRRGFGKVWREEPSVRQILSWATQPEQADRATLQYFDRGWMLWLQGADTVYVFDYDRSTVMWNQRIK